MLSEQRREMILKELEIHQLLTITDIVKLTQSSEATIRRDLDRLAQQDLLVRVHGGCKKKPSVGINETTMTERLQEHKIAKNKIAAYVCQQYIHDDMVIYLDAGTSIHSMVPFLVNKDVLIVTNGVHHIMPLVQQGNKVILLGGYVKSMTQAVVGGVCLEQLENYSFDLAFMGANGVDNEFGVSTPDVEEAKIKKAAMKSAKQTIFIIDSSKFDKKCFAKIANLEECLIYTEQYPKHYQYFSTIKEVTV